MADEQQTSFTKSIITGSIGWLKGMVAGIAVGALAGGVLGAVVGLVGGPGGVVGGAMMGASIGSSILGGVAGSVGLVRDVAKELDTRHATVEQVQQVAQVSFKHGVDLGLSQGIEQERESTRFRDRINQERQQTASRALH
jgi:flagellar motor component MotA